MNYLDKLIEFISPQRAFRRQQYRSALDAKRNYDAGRLDRLGGGWTTINATAEQTDVRYRDRLRARARDLERNNDIVEAIVAGIVRNSVGGGFKLQARTSDEDLNVQIEKLWRRWSKARNCDITGQSSFAEMLSLILRREIYDGEVLVVKVYDRSANIPFKLQLREADDLDTSLTQAPNGNYIQGGVELNAYSKPVAYWFYDRKPDGFMTHQSIRVEAQRVMHLFGKTRPTQVRGISQLARSMDRMRDTNEYLEAERVKARIAACLAVFVETDAPTQKVGRMAVDSATKQRQDVIEPGMIEYLKPGEKMTIATPGGINTNAKDFVQLNQRLAGAGAGISYELASRDYSQVNFSSARQGLLEDQKTFGAIQNYLIEHFCQEVYTEFLISAVVAGKLQIKDFFGDKKEDYCEHEWITPGWSWIDPLKEANASGKELELGINTRARIAAAQGRDWRDDMQQLAKEQQLAKDLGLELNSKGDGSQNGQTEKTGPADGTDGETA